MLDLRSASTSCKIAALVGLFYIFVSMVAAVFPDVFVASLDWRTESGIYSMAALDLVIGTILIWAAPSSRSADGFHVLGGLALLSAVYYFLAPMQIVVPYLDWWLLENIVLTRFLSVLFGLPIGLFIIFAAVGSPNSTLGESDN